MTDGRVTIRELTHESRKVFDRLQHERRLVITNAGRVVGVLNAPDPDETQLDEWAAAGQAPADWRDRQQGLRSFLAHASVRTSPAGQRAGSAAVLAEREETDR
ncbi:hypothetical protein IQ251_16605 [Saccharopolyspora sp. HNM0983]|uniref:Antitoxin n=1 Tax=Saccharopolyspora montiporae TaxID=2781240 RepID=A0A929G191_9PSEU|nr:hypothetical protein [Saccharopolyspora sp. HNM0983]MBE9376074.1 hypothetical protein [Saccharopolyspora sp. HNM0983]